MSLNWSLLLDVVMIAMMAGTMVYAFVLNRNLTKLRESKNEFEVLVQKLTQSITKAEMGLRDMKLSAQEVGGNLETQISHARGLSQELQFMIESADSLADRLMRAAESGSSAAAAEAAKTAPAAPAGLFGGKKPVDNSLAAKAKSRAESELMADLNRVAEARAAKKEVG
jgi:hypothetical protein